MSFWNMFKNVQPESKVDNDFGFDFPAIRLSDIHPLEGTKTTAHIYLNDKAAEHLGLNTKESRENVYLAFGKNESTNSIVITAISKDSDVDVAVKAKVNKGSDNESFAYCANKKARNIFTEDLSEVYFKLENSSYGEGEDKINFLEVKEQVVKNVQATEEEHSQEVF